VAFFSRDPQKRRVEQLVLAYSPLWMAAIAIVQYEHWFTRWGDAGHLAFGLALALPVWLLALASAHGARFALLITLMSLIQNYFGAMLFFDAFGMQYHFPVHWIVHRTPLFLYAVTVAYFATYYVVLNVAWRALQARFPSRGARLLFRALLSYAVAFAETFCMANKSLQAWFSYRDPRAVMWFGSIAYGTLFFITMPLFYDLDERQPTSARRAIWDCLALNMLILICYELYSVAYTRLIA
jgi:cycloeucalenol cycloisomerase